MDAQSGFLSFVILVLFGLVISGTHGTVNVCVPVSNSSEPNATVTSHLRIFEDLKSSIQDEIESKNDTIDVGTIAIDLTHPAIRLIGTMENVYVSNFTRYNLCLLDIDLAESKFDVFNLTFPDIYVQGDYDFDGNLGDLFPFFGKGPFWIRMTNFSIAMTHFNLSMSEEICFPINIDINLLQMHNQFDGLLNDPELEILFNDVMEALGPQILEILWSEAKDAIDGPLEDLIDKMLHGKNVAEALNLVLRLRSTSPQFEGTNIPGLPDLPYCFGSDDVINNTTSTPPPN